MVGGSCVVVPLEEPLEPLEDDFPLEDFPLEDDLPLLFFEDDELEDEESLIWLLLLFPGTPQALASVVARKRITNLLKELTFISGISL